MYFRLSMQHPSMTLCAATEASCSSGAYEQCLLMMVCNGGKRKLNAGWWGAKMKRRISCRGTGSKRSQALSFHAEQPVVTKEASSSELSSH